MVHCVICTEQTLIVRVPSYMDLCINTAVVLIQAS